MPLQIIRQDITAMHVDAIVNTTNEKMIPYSGIDLAVHQRGGVALDAECAALAPLGLGEAKITGGHGLDCRYVIHTSGPVWQGGLMGESVILRSCYMESLKLAAAHGAQTVAVPLISAGAYGYPKDQVLKFASATIGEFLDTHEMTVYLCVFDRASYTFSRELYREICDFIEKPPITECADMLSVCREEAIVPPQAERRRKGNEACASALPPLGSYMNSAAGKALPDYLRERDKGFREMLFDLIDESGMSDVECYKRANVDKRTFSKIKGQKDYRPSKQTALAFAIALRLDLDATQELLATLGLTLSKSLVFDKIIRYFIHNERYDILEINEALFEFDQVLLGCVSERN